MVSSLPAKKSIIDSDTKHYLITIVEYIIIHFLIPNETDGTNISIQAPTLLHGYLIQEDFIYEH